MIGWFPDPYPDELFYSVCARYFERMSYSNEIYVTQELFGKKLTSLNVYLANNLDYLIKHLPSGHCYKADYLIDNHTLLPFCSPFYAPYIIKKIRKEITQNTTKFTFHKPRITYNDYYSPELLELLRCELAEQTKNCWLIDIFIFDGKIRNPLYYLLLIIFLGYTSKSFFNIFDGKSKFFKENNELCSNQYCRYFQDTTYQENPIIISNNDVNIAECYCNSCEFIYKPLELCNVKDDVLPVSSRRTKYGYYWELGLKTLWNNHSITIAEIAEELGVREETIEKQAIYLKLP
ncbi:TnsD family Tn7-like transposition protein [Nostoc sp. FACHB-280]|uniref:TnsD family Tn7-like transposition protein n=1 Tax=Nostoc sp. FACHB-280 TaxID=2692839 RepID=UPI00168B8C6B|nr:TnsD family Tn7-like transposition protein [Nostoc sp. FACHB-280]MBD2498895.1 hypothetical protein [Nostoc sp. FACHB-280]